MSATDTPVPQGSSHLPEAAPGISDHLCLMTWDLQNDGVTCSRRLLDLLGRPHAMPTMPREDLLNHIDDSDREAFRAALAAVSDAEFPSDAPCAVTVRLTSDTEDAKHCRVEFTRLPDTSSTAPSVIGVVVDISSDMAAHQQLQDLHANMELAQRAAGFGIWAWDLHTEELFWDDRSCELHGMTRETLPEDPVEWMQNMDPAERDEMFARFADAIATQTEYHGEYRVYLPGGTERIIQGNAVILRNAAGKPLRAVGTNIDLTETRRKEAALIEAKEIALRAQKAETIGNLTGGVAHDFNNLLAVIQGNIELLKEHLEELTSDTEPMELADAVLAATARGAELTKNMLAYARRARLEPVVIDINALISETRNWVRRTIETNVSIETRLAPDLPPLMADRSSLQNALVNLILNARDAMPDGGSIVITTEFVPIDDLPFEPLRGHGSVDSYVAISVSDTGHGIAPDKLDQVFEPFFTTKAAGQGTGLGLSMVQGFVDQTGGTITVHSETGLGTTFKILLPAFIKKDQSDGRPTQTPRLSAPAPGLRVLLVEDDVAVMQTMTRMLEREGHLVRQARDGDTAYDLLRSNAVFDILITDVMMPGELQGNALAREARRLVPGLPTIVMSGYVFDAGQDKVALAEDVVVLKKPVTKLELSHAITRATGGKVGGIESSG